ncbi:helix-turn-helix domain-containing protein [Lentilactobacillus parafarraginis]|uniref:HTH cro/C1-type domain-containing protein n=2 Tax=Lentilactobacillus parafarraginis TaxID=390842 RepID=A0A0R1YMF0_9LACO|nr:helix-turn-helix domain-containing protein [Lentilactobacillus parafarraginis]KRM43279.1 hypothetical protein FD47_GL001656 [Lentilactobacillus parafarraginis DSM 18390 = JCM 14109]
MRIGTQLQRQRQLNGLSQNQLAEALHISRQSISKWENGSALPNFANVMAISNLFHISLDDLIKGDAVLMNQLENEHKTSKVADILIIGFGMAIFVFIVLSLLSVSEDAVATGLSLISVISFIGLIFSIKWRLINQALKKGAVVWGAILIATLLIPEFYGFIQGFIGGMPH